MLQFLLDYPLGDKRLQGHLQVCLLLGLLCECHARPQAAHERALFK